jgi:hypothetical protein
VEEVTPYIIVDGQRITPVGWPPRSDLSIAERKGAQALAFEVVDRVTISREAREKCRCLDAIVETDSTISENLSNKSKITTTPALIYLPKQRVNEPILD